MAQDLPFRSELRGPFLVGLAATLCVLLATLAPAQDRLSKVQSLYAQESDPVRKAKLLGEMGPLEVDHARATFKSGSDEQALEILTHYNDEVQKAIAALIATRTDAVKRPAGFKELQIGLRVSLRRLDDFILGIPVEKRPWFRSVRSDLADVQNKLIDALFQTGGNAAPHSEDADKNDKDTEKDKDQ